MHSVRILDVCFVGRLSLTRRVVVVEGIGQGSLLRGNMLSFSWITSVLCTVRHEWDKKHQFIRMKLGVISVSK